MALQSCESEVAQRKHARKDTLFNTHDIHLEWLSLPRQAELSWKNPFAPKVFEIRCCVYLCSQMNKCTKEEKPQVVAVKKRHSCPQEKNKSSGHTSSNNITILWQQQYVFCQPWGRMLLNVWIAENYFHPPSPPSPCLPFLSLKLTCNEAPGTQCWF